MPSWLLRGLRRGVVTTRYPRGPAGEATAHLPSPPEFRSDLLTEALADALEQVCPSRALHHEGAHLVFDVGACSACGRCLRVAGEAARPSDEVELAAHDRSDLVKRIPLQGGRE